VLVHDAARPLIQVEVIELAARTAHEQGAALVAVPVSDTLKTSASGTHAERTLDRSVLWAAQTPQAFRRAVLVELLARAAADEFEPTDDCALHERYLGPVPIVAGDPSNLKITTPSDLMIAEALLASRAKERA
jgi:2-C-methyl-D-erythritol 4-phosphate cytidylyltransferase